MCWMPCPARGHDYGTRTMNNPTPEYNTGDRIEIPHRRIEGEIIYRSYNESNEAWIYRVLDERDNVGLYQEKNLEQ